MSKSFRQKHLCAVLLAVWLAGCGARPAAPVAQANQAGVSAAPIELCGIANVAWTIEGVLARSAQPPESAWRCLKERGFTTIVRQNVEGDRGEQRAVEQAGMSYVGSYAIPDQTAYAPAMLEAMINDIVARLKRGEHILVHDAGGRGRMGFWEAAFLIWDGWTPRDAIDRSVAMGWKLECAKGGNGQMQGLNEIAAALGQPTYYPARDSFGTAWKNCPRPAYMDGWDYRTIRWPEGGGALWSKTGRLPL